MSAPEEYTVVIIQRDGMGQISDDFHATITRKSDGVQLISISKYRRLLRWKTRRASIERAFKRYDERQMKLQKKEVFER